MTAKGFLKDCGADMCISKGKQPLVNLLKTRAAFTMPAMSHNGIGKCLTRDLTKEIMSKAPDHAATWSREMPMWRNWYTRPIWNRVSTAELRVRVPPSAPPIIGHNRFFGKRDPDRKWRIARVLRYRIRKPKGLTICEEILENIKEPENA